MRLLKRAIARLRIKERYGIILMSEVRRVIAEIHSEEREVTAENRNKKRKKPAMTRKRVKTLQAYEIEEYGNTNITGQIKDLFTEGTNDRT